MAILSRNKLKNSGVILSFIIFFAFFIIPLFLKAKFNLIPFIFSFALYLTSFVNPYLLRKPINYWIKFGNILGRINSVVILFLFFYLIIVPSSFLRYFINFFFKKKKGNINSYYILKEKFDKTNFSDQF